VELAQWGLLIHTLLGQLLKEFDGTGGFEISRTLAAFGSISQDF
jgi:hypothetical protein